MPDRQRHTGIDGGRRQAPPAAGHARLATRRATTLIGIAAAAVVVAAGWSLLAPSAAGGWLRVAAVQGHSMVPALADGDLVVAARAGQYQVGDTVVYDKYGGAVIHVLVSFDPGRGWTTRGLNTNAPDPWPVPPDAIRGRLLWRIPGGANALRWLQAHPLVPPVAALALFLLAEALAATRARHRRHRIPGLDRILRTSRPESPPADVRAAEAVAGVLVGLPVLAAVALLALHRTTGTPWQAAISFLIAGLVVAVVLRLMAVHSRDPRVVLAGRLFTVPPGTGLPPAPAVVARAADLDHLAAPDDLPVIHRPAPPGRGCDPGAYYVLTPTGTYCWPRPAPASPAGPAGSDGPGGISAGTVGETVLPIRRPREHRSRGRLLSRPARRASP